MPSRADPTATPGQVPDPSDQLELIGTRGGLLPRASRPKPGHSRAPVAAAVDPVATVCLDSPLHRLNRPFEYLIPDHLDSAAQFGVRVRVPLGRQRSQGWIVGRSSRREHAGRHQWIQAVVGTEALLTPQTLRLCRAVADHYLGTLADVLRLAVPPRGAGTPAAKAQPLVNGAARAERLAPGPGRSTPICPARIGPTGSRALSRRRPPRAARGWRSCRTDEICGGCGAASPS